MRSSDDATATPSGRLRVAYVLKRFPQLSETFVLNEILELERQRIAVDVFSLRPAKEATHHDLLGRLQATVTYLPDRRELASPGHSDDFNHLMSGKRAAKADHLVAQARLIARAAKVRKLQHIHAHFMSDATTAALIAARGAGLPFSFTAHARDIFHCYVSPRVDDQVRRTKLQAARFAVTVSDFNKRHLDQLAGEDGTCRIVRLYNGIDVARFAPASHDARQEGLILSVARLVEKKGLDDLIEACGILSRSGCRFRCVIVGDGPLRDALAAQIATLDLCDTVVLAGAQPHERVREMMQRAAVMVLPCVVAASGDRDGLPTVLLEALASGLPAISTTVAGIPEIIMHERTGLLATPSAPDELAAAMQRLFADPLLSARLAAQGREHALRQFNLTTNVATLARLFDDSRRQHASNTMRAADAHRLPVG